MQIIQKRLTKFFYYYSLFGFILMGCVEKDLIDFNQISEETISESPIVKPDNGIITLSHKEIPTIMNDLLSRIGKNSKSINSGKLLHNNVNVDLEHIQQMVNDSLNTNYSFALDVKGSPNSIYNLVMSQKLDGSMNLPVIIAYTMKPKDMEAFFHAREDYSYFKADFKYYTLDTFFNDSKFNRVGKSGDCGGGSTGGGGGSSSPTAPGSTFSHTYNGHTVTNIFSSNAVNTPYGYSVSIRTQNAQVSTVSTVGTSGTVQISTPGPNGTLLSHNVPSHTVSVGAASDAGASGPGQICLTISSIGDGHIVIESIPCQGAQQKRLNTSKSGDCASTDGTFAINTTAKAVKKLDYYLPGGLNAGQLQWFNDSDFPERKFIAQELVWFMISNNHSDQAVQFVLLAVDALTKGGSVDVDEQIINKLSGKAECVFDKLQNLSSNIFKDILTDTFMGSKESHILFEVGNIPDEANFSYNARTYPSFNGNGSQRFYRIRLKTSFVENASNIEIALALIHESIHAELLERSIQSGLVLNIASNGGYTFQNYGNPSTLNNNTIFNTLSTYYKNLGNSNPQWNHDQFNIFGYRDAMKDNLEFAHPWLDSYGNPFISVINSDPVINNLDDFFDSISWGGLEATQEYINLNSTQKTKIQYIFQKMKSSYNQLCTN